MRSEKWISVSQVELAEEARFYSKRVEGVKHSVIPNSTDNTDRKQ
jgi:hypothetical protein